LRLGKEQAARLEVRADRFGVAWRAHENAQAKR